MLFRTAILALCALSPLAYSSPIKRRHHPDGIHVATSPARRDISPNPFFSFNNWHGNANLNNFDGFFGLGNFNGFNNQQVIVVEEKLVCSQRDLRVVQQKLAILTELSKRIILEQVCDVVSQVLVFEQFFNVHRQFGRDISRGNGNFNGNFNNGNFNRFVGFDQDIASKFGSIFDEQGNLSFGDLGFNGFDIGGHLAQFNDNWNDAVSPGEIAALFQALQQAFGFNFGGFGGFGHGGFNNGGSGNNNGGDNNNGDNNGEVSSTEEVASETASVAEPTESAAARRWW